MTAIQALEPSTDRRNDAWLVPAYVFTTDANATIATSAVTDESLQEAIDDDATTTAPAPDNDEANCTSTPPNQSIDPTNAPIAAEVCADKTTYHAGDVATFSINAASMNNRTLLTSGIWPLLITT